jgi:hypothetical protein
MSIFPKKERLIHGCRRIMLPLWIGKNYLKMAFGQSVNRRKAVDRTMRWLCIAQDNADGGGVSTAYDLRYGWQMRIIVSAP